MRNVKRHGVSWRMAEHPSKDAISKYEACSSVAEAAGRPQSGRAGVVEGGGVRAWAWLRMGVAMGGGVATDGACRGSRPPPPPMASA